jgi:hypothetical protein
MRKRNLLYITAFLIFALTLSWVTVFAGQTEAGQARVGVPAGSPMASAHFQVGWNIGANGGGVTGSTHFQVSSTIGQPVVGHSGSSNFDICSGFWCKVLAIFDVYLPILNNN